MITELHKLEIGRLLREEVAALGGWKRVAAKVAANEVTIRYNMQDRAKWPLVADKKWADVGGRLGFKLSYADWQMVPTTNTSIMTELLASAQTERMFRAISHGAGQGKTAGAMMYKAEHDGVFYLEAEESWSHKRFVQKLAGTLGVSTAGLNVSDLTDEIVAFLKRKSADTMPLLIVDEANKLKPSSLRLFIPLFNKLKDEIGMVLIGAHDLKKHIQGGVRRDARGYDELESRLGRAYMPLVGIFEEDVQAICQANGLTDKAAQRKVWDRMQPEKVSINGVYHWLSRQDARVLEQAVKHERTALSRKRDEVTNQLAIPALA